ncbi:MAG: DNA repair protein RecO [Bacteroidales bacterium]
MENNSFKLIVLHSFRHKEWGVVIRGYSNQHGKCSLYLKAGANSKQHNLSLLHPLSPILITPVKKRIGEMINIKEYEPLFKLSAIREDIRKGSIALFLAEIILKSIREVEQNTPLYNFLESSIVLLEEKSVGVANFHLWFLSHLLFHLGYSPIYPYQSGSAELLEESLSLLQGEEDLLRSLYTLSADSLDSIKISGRRRSQFLTKVLNYLSYHQNCDIESLSLPILQELFSD